MANSFTVFPNVLPGNVTIGGNLTVSGDQLRIGTASPFVRVGKDTSGRLMLSRNLGFDITTLDSAGVQAMAHLSTIAGDIFAIRRVNTAGSSVDNAYPFTIFTDFTAHNHTGTVTEDTIYSKVIRANTLTANAGLRMLMLYNSTTQGAPVTTIKVKLNGSLAVQWTFGATGGKFAELTFNNRNALNSNIITFIDRTAAGATNASGYFDTNAFDMSVDQTLTVTCTNGTSTDVQNFDSIRLELVNSFGPV